VISRTPLLCEIHRTAVSRSTDRGTNTGGSIEVSS
jgi:hypothetical protein